MARSLICFSALITLALLGTFSAPSAALAQVITSGSLKICYFMFAGVDDLGWSYSFNQGRLRAHAAIQSAYPNLQVESLVATNVFFGVSDKKALTLQYIYKGCRIFIMNNEMLIGDPDVDHEFFAKTYPNITFFLLHSERLENTTYANRIYFYTDPSVAFYMAGVAAAKQASTCISFTVAWEIFPNPVDALNGFILGVRSVNTSKPIEVVKMDNWYAPIAEPMAAALLTSAYGCEVHGHYSDPRAVDVAFSSSSSVMTVGPHSDLQQFVGDSVLMAGYLQWENVFIPWINATIWYGNPPSTGASAKLKPPYRLTTAVDAVVYTSVSPLASKSVQAAVDAQKSVASQQTIFCGSGLTTRAGKTITYRTGATCMHPADNILGFLAFSNVHYHAQVFLDGSSCPPGMYVTHTVKPELTMTCVACGANTFSPSWGSASCTPCANGTTSGINASSCVVIADTSAQTVTIAVTASVVGVAVIMSAIIVVCCARSKNAKRNEAAPQKVPMGLLFTDIEGSTELWSKYPDSMSVAIDLHHRAIREVIASVDAYEVKTVGDSFMIATKTTLDAALVATEIQRAMFRIDWPDDLKWLAGPGQEITSGVYASQASLLPSQDNQAMDPKLWNGLRVRVGLQHCTQIEPKYEALSNYYDYYGQDVNKCARVEAQAFGGQVLMTRDTYDAIKADPDYKELLHDQVMVCTHAEQVVLKGIDETLTLMSMLPIELAERSFPHPLSGITPGKGISKSDSDIHGGIPSISIAEPSSANMTTANQIADGRATPRSSMQPSSDHRSGTAEKAILFTLAQLDAGARSSAVNNLAKKLGIAAAKNLIRLERSVVQSLVSKLRAGGLRSRHGSFTQSHDEGASDDGETPVVVARNRDSNNSPHPHSQGNVPSPRTHSRSQDESGSPINGDIPGIVKTDSPR